jgi:1-acyl-sn-glycerol-3-phosphate acyltransferase
MRRAAAALESGMNIWVSPEGTRSLDGRLGEFRKGGFHLAMDAGARILPVCIDGTAQVLPAKAKVVRPGATVRVEIRPPVAPQAYGNERLDELVAAVREAISAPLHAG